LGPDGASGSALSSVSMAAIRASISLTRLLKKRGAGGVAAASATLAARRRAPVAARSPWMRPVMRGSGEYAPGCGSAFTNNVLPHTRDRQDATIA